MDSHLGETVEILWAARALREVVDDVAPAAAPELAPRMDELLTKAARSSWSRTELGPVIDELASTLAEHPEIRAWMREFHERFTSARSGSVYLPMPGYGSPVPPSGTYVCGACGFVWVRRAAGQDVPLCPKDGDVLEAGQ